MSMFVRVVSQRLGGILLVLGGFLVFATPPMPVPQVSFIVAAMSA